MIFLMSPLCSDAASEGTRRGLRCSGGSGCVSVRWEQRAELEGPGVLALTACRRAPGRPGRQNQAGDTGEGPWTVSSSGGSLCQGDKRLATEGQGAVLRRRLLLPLPLPQLGSSLAVSGDLTPQGTLARRLSCRTRPPEPPAAALGVGALKVTQPLYFLFLSSFSIFLMKL